MEAFIYPKKEEWNDLLARPTASYEELESLVSQVFLQVQKDGDKAVAAYTQQFDQIALKTTAVNESEIAHASSSVSDELKQSIQLAKANIEAFTKPNKHQPSQWKLSQG